MLKSFSGERQRDFAKTGSLVAGMCSSTPYAKVAALNTGVVSGGRSANSCWNSSLAVAAQELNSAVKR